MYNDFIISVKLFVANFYVHYYVNSWIIFCWQRSRVIKSAVIDSKRDGHVRGSKPIRTIRLCPWERHCTALSSAYQAVLNLKYKNRKESWLVPKHCLKLRSKKNFLNTATFLSLSSLQCYCSLTIVIHNNQNPYLEPQELRDSPFFERFAKRNCTIDIRKAKAKSLQSPGISCKNRTFKIFKGSKTFSKSKQEIKFLKEKFSKENVIKRRLNW